MTLVNTGGVPAAVAQEMVRNVSGMSITYHVNGGTTYVNAATVGANWGQVDSVMLNFKLQSATQYTDTKQQPLTRQMYMTVTLRNRV
jgi:type IV pilus assembly protein PilW